MNRQALFLGTDKVQVDFITELESHDFNENVQVETVKHYFSGFGLTELSDTFYEGTGIPQVWFSPREVNLSKFTFKASGKVFYLITQASLGEANLILRDVISLQNNKDVAKKVMMDYASNVDFKESKNVFTKPCMFRNILDYANSRYIEGIFTSEKDALIYLYAFFGLGKFSQVDSKESFMEYCEANIESLFQRIQEEEDDLLVDDSDDEWELEWRSEWERDFNEELPLEESDEDEY